MPIQRVTSKWAKTEALLSDASLKEKVPATRRMSRRSVEELLREYGMIYVKPVSGTFGKGVVRVEKREGTAMPYFCQSGVHKHRFATLDLLYAKLLAISRGRPYLAQQGIQLLKHAGRRFDLRVMVQVSPQSRWETTGIIGRLAHPRKIVTNYHSGGTPMPIEKLMSSHMTADQLGTYAGRLRRLGVDTARAMQRRFPRVKEIGVDVAVDRKLKPWILEVNTLPDPYIFRKLPNRSVFRRIYRYAVAYGRFRRRANAAR